jgi:hypothetical protein
MSPNSHLGGVCYNIGEFMRFRAGVDENEALLMGRPIYSEARIVTQAELGKVSPEERRSSRIIARDRAHVTWAEGPALVMLDLDRPDDFPPEIQARVPTTPDGWRDLLVDLIPELKPVQMAWVPSSSSYLYRDDEELQGLRGQRFYFVIESGLATPRFAEALHDQLTLRGLAWYSVSKSGSLLKRMPFDLAVFKPEHLDFAAAPACVTPLEWRPPKHTIWNESGEQLAPTTIPRTTEADRQKIKAILNAAKRAKADEARAVRREWIKATERRIAQHSGKPKSAAKVARAALRLEVLLPDFVLIDAEGKAVTVGELLDDPVKHNGRRFRDPLEPDYRDDPRIAVFMVDERGRACIYSHAHGGQWWRCVRNTPTVRLGLVDETVDQIREALEQDDCGLYRSGNGLVTVNKADGTLCPLDENGVGLRLQRRFNVLGQDRNRRWVPKNIPLRDLKALASEVHDLPIPPIVGVVRGPYAHRDGSVVDTPDYDPTSQVVYLADSLHPPTARRTVSVEQAREAVRTLWHAVSKFPYVSNVDRGVVLSALLTAVARPSLPITPGYLISAHTAGTGKTLLAQTIGALQTGSTIAATALPREDDEVRKHVFAALRQGSTYLLYDNAQRGSEIDSPVLAGMITGEVIEGRVLGASSVERRPNRLSVVVTGNNVMLHGDLNRRLLTVRLDANVEHPWEREFDFHPVTHTLANWLPLRIAALEIIQAWLTAGAPLAPGSTGFPDWDAIVRSVVVWVAECVDTEFGFADPAIALKEAYAEDPESNTLGSLLQPWHAVFGDREILLRELDDLVDRVETFDPLSTSTDPSDGERALVEARRAVVGHLPRGTDETQKLGQFLTRHQGHIVGGLKLNRGGLSGGSRRWSVTRVLTESAGHVSASRAIESRCAAA